jgi:hypothetical protein
MSHCFEDCMLAGGKHHVGKMPVIHPDDVTRRAHKHWAVSLTIRHILLLGIS